MEVNWTIQKSDKQVVKKLSLELGVNEIVAHLLVVRGITTYDMAKSFFRPQISDLHSPFLMKGMENAIGRIELAIKKGEKILIYGDYDVDGTTSVAMMYSFLSRFTDKIGYYFCVLATGSTYTVHAQSIESGCNMTLDSSGNFTKC